MPVVTPFVSKEFLEGHVLGSWDDMPQQDRSPSSRLNTYPDATGGQRLTATVVALVAALPAGLLCAWLATSLLNGVHWLVQTLAFAVIGLIIGAGVLGLLARHGKHGKG
ncbi:hypothetical protein SAMN05444365_103171 [Micromonospora pattaloongensis]|uniref:Uncharacterized protein n=1 Tax=Micromonospora pattaloongensis TaxID=405436 RepID=A0A1H3LZS7_9ACTN|nr:hypothetical protein [Micromonospora pattaloongensis]SDY69971.1 hypothetical protein SAMN05444365_103171 [Micromonospora pattaloongensis]